MRTPHNHPQVWLLGLCYCNFSRHQRYPWRVLLWQQATKDTKDTYHRASQAPQMPPPLYPAEAASKRPPYVSGKTEPQCLQPRQTEHPRKSHCTLPHLHNHSSLGLWPTCRRNAGLRPQHSPWRLPTLKHGTGGAIQELPRAETRPIDFHYCHGSPRALQPLQPTGYSANSKPQRAATARASHLTWGSNQRPQKLPCVTIDITRAPISTLAAGTRRKCTVLSKELTV